MGGRQAGLGIWGELQGAPCGICLTSSEAASQFTSTPPLYFSGVSWCSPQTQLNPHMQPWKVPKLVPKLTVRQSNAFESTPLDERSYSHYHGRCLGRVIILIIISSVMLTSLRPCFALCPPPVPFFHLRDAVERRARCGRGQSFTFLKTKFKNVGCRLCVECGLKSGHPTVLSLDFPLARGDTPKSRFLEMTGDSMSRCT